MAHQLQIGRYSAKDSLDSQEDIDISESEDSFCLQMQIKKSQTDQESCDTTLRNQFALQSEALWQENKNSQSQDWHMLKYKYNASQHIQDNI